MSHCSYVNEENSGPMNGWYCNAVGAYVDSSLYQNYCSGSAACQYCPHLGGDDRFRTGPGQGRGSVAEAPFDAPINDGFACIYGPPPINDGFACIYGPPPVNRVGLRERFRRFLGRFRRG